MTGQRWLREALTAVVVVMLAAIFGIGMLFAQFHPGAPDTYTTSSQRPGGVL